MGRYFIIILLFAASCQNKLGITEKLFNEKHNKYFIILTNPVECVLCQKELSYMCFKANEKSNFAVVLPKARKSVQNDIMDEFKHFKLKVEFNKEIYDQLNNILVEQGKKLPALFIISNEQIEDITSLNIMEMTKERRLLLNEQIKEK